MKKIQTNLYIVYKSKIHFMLKKHKPIKLKFPTRKVFAPELDFLQQADLVEMPKSLAAENNGFNYILTVIEVFSKYAFAREIKRKNGNYVTEAFANIFKTEEKNSRTNTN